MARTPTGSIFSVATAFGSAKTVSGITNANPAVVTATAHGFSNGDVVEITSGWGRLNKRAFEIGSVTTDTFTLVGANTTSTDFYPSGSSGGSVREATTFTQLTKVMNPSSSGGEPKSVSYKFVDSDVEYSINDGFTATSYTLQLDDDDTTAGYTALRSLTDVQSDTILKILLKNGSRIYLPGTVALNDVPSMQDGQIMTMSVQFSGNARHTRYTA